MGIFLFFVRQTILVLLVSVVITLKIWRWVKLGSVLAFDLALLVLKPPEIK